jgi:hypothetical protein
MNILYRRLKNLLCCFTLTLLILLTIPAVARAAAINSLISATDPGYLGTGFNSLRQEFIYDNTCLTFHNIGTETADRVSTSSYYCFVNSRQELAEKFLTNFAASSGPTPKSTAVSKATAAIINNTVLSTDKITIIAYWKQEDKRVYSADLPVINNEAMAVLKQSPRTFAKTYGDQYVSAVTIGKIIYLVYQTDISGLASYTDRTKNPIKKAMELNIKKILGAKLTVAETDFATSLLSKLDTTIHTYGNDIESFIGPYSADDFQDLLKKISSAPSGVIASELKDYFATANRRGDNFCNMTEYASITKIWNRHLSNLNYILANPRLSLNLAADCRTVARYINSQLELVYSLGSESRLPNSKETDTLNNLYKRYLIELHLTPRTYETPTIKGNPEIDLSKINDVDTIKITYIRPRSFIWYLFFRNTKVGLLTLDQYGNWSVLATYKIGRNKTITLYEGTKISNKFLINFSSDRIKTSSIKVVVTFTEKTDDVIWLYLRTQA